MTIILHC